MCEEEGALLGALLLSTSFFFLREIAQLSGTLLLMKVLQLYSGDPVKLVVVKNSFTVWINLGFLTLHTDGNICLF